MDPSLADTIADTAIVIAALTVLHLTVRAAIIAGLNHGLAQLAVYATLALVSAAVGVPILRRVRPPPT